MARILILRDAAAAAPTAQRVEAMGDEPVVLPVHRIEPLTPPLPAGPFGGLIVTSANAVPFLAASIVPPHPPILAVGEATAEALAAAGFAAAHVGTAGGQALAGEAARLHERSGLPLLYLAGRVRTDGLERAMSALSVPLATLDVYDTLPLDTGRETVRRALACGPVEAVLILSVGQARAASILLDRHPDLFAPLPIPLCLSPRIFEALTPALRRAALVSPMPELSALLEHYRQARGRPSPNGGHKSLQDRA